MTEDKKRQLDEVPMTNIVSYLSARLFNIEECIRRKDKCIEKLEKENAELKEFKQDCVKLTEDNVVMARQRAETSKQLTKAKAIIKDYMIIATGDHTTVCSVPEENRCIDVLKLNEQAEQFLKEPSK